jgi:hypothetical protein
MLKRFLLAAAILLAAALPSPAANQFADNICEQTATTGTGTVNLAGKITTGRYAGTRSFSEAGITSGNSVPYSIETGTGDSRKIEIGWGVYTDGTPDTLSRDASSTTDDSTPAITELTLAGTSTVCVGINSLLLTGGSGYGINADSIDGIDSTGLQVGPLSGDVVTSGAAATIQANSVALTTDTSGNYALGDAEGGAATTGDSATSFFSTGTIEDARIDGSAEADEVNPTLGTQTQGNYLDNVTGSATTGIAVTHTPAEGSEPAVAFDFTDKGADPALTADTCVFSGDATTNGEIVCEGDTANASESRIVITEPTGDRAFTIPDADSFPFSTGDKGDVSINSATDIQLDADSVGANEISAGGVGTSEAAALDAGDITTGTFTDAQVAGSGEADELTLAGDVDGVANSNDIDEANVEAELEGVIDEADLQVSDQGTDPALATDRCAYTTDATTAGNIVCEGDTANTSESRMDFGDPTGDRVFTLPDANSYPITDKDYGDITVSASGQTWAVDADTIALPGDTTGVYVAQVADGTGIDGSANAENATYTPSLDMTEVNAFTLGGGSATGITFDVSAGDPQILSGANTLTFTGSGTTPVLIVDDQGAMRFTEEDAGGSNYKGFAAPAAVTADTTCVFEDDASFIPDSCVGDGTDAGGTDTLGPDGDKGDITVGGTGTTLQIDADAVTLTTDTNGNYVGTVADGTGIDGTASGEGTTYTPTLDLTEIATFTLGTANATGILFDAGATDSAIETASGTFTIDIGGSNVLALGASNDWGVAGHNVLVTADDGKFVIERQDAALAEGVDLVLYANSLNSAAAGEGNTITFAGRASNSTMQEYGEIKVDATTVTSGSEVGTMTIMLANSPPTAVTNFTALTMSPTSTTFGSGVSILPGADGTSDIGTASLGVRDIFITSDLELGGGTATTVTEGSAAGMATVEGKPIITASNVQVLTSGSGATYTPTSGTKFWKVTCVGGGGGGGGSDNGDTSANNAGGGGSGGGTSVAWMDATEMGANAVYTVGAGGTAGANTGGTGGTGTSSSFNPAGTGATMTCNGGVGGPGTVTSADGWNPGAAPGTTPTGGDFNIAGGAGGYGVAATASGSAYGGTGGASSLGGAGLAPGSQAAGCTAGGDGVANTGGGGAGARCRDTLAGAAGGVGGTGVIIVEEFGS